MTKRITLTMVAVVAGALLVASLGTLLVFRLEAGAQARRDLGRQAERLAGEVEALEAPGAFGAVARALRLEGQAVVRVGPDARVRGPLPSGLTAADLEPERLLADRTVTGVRGSLAFAAAPARPRQPGPVLAVVVTRQVGIGRPLPGPWFLAALLGTLAVAAAVAARLGRRLTRPLRAAEEATRRIAGGDLAVRVPEPEDGGEDLARLARSINSMAAGLERSRGLERQFLLSVSHDLRTPLRSIRGFAEALTEGRATDPAHAASIIGAEARRLERLVGDLLELAKLDARRFSLDLRGVDVVEVASDTAEGFRPAGDQAGVAITVDGSSTLLATADPDRLAQVMANLIENALTFAVAQIRIGAGRGDDGSVSVWVVDDGPGIDPDDLPHVFEPFYRSARHPARDLGSGLGLAIVAELVGGMGGSVAAEPVPGGGTRVVVTLRPWQMAASVARTD